MQSLSNDASFPSSYEAIDGQRLLNRARINPAIVASHIMDTKWKSTNVTLH